MNTEPLQKTIFLRLTLLLVCFSMYFSACNTKTSDNQNANNVNNYDLKGKWISEDNKTIMELYNKAYFTYLSDSSKQIWDYEIDNNIIKFYNPNFGSLEDFIDYGCGTKRSYQILNFFIDNNSSQIFENFVKQRFKFYTIVDEKNIVDIKIKFHKEN